MSLTKYEYTRQVRHLERLVDELDAKWHRVDGLNKMYYELIKYLCKRPYLSSGSLEMAEGDALCAKHGFKPWENGVNK